MESKDDHTEHSALTRRGVCRTLSLAGLGASGLGRSTARTVRQVSEGKVRWKSALDVHASPAVDGRTLYVPSTDTNVYALDGATGARQWKFETTDDLRTSPTVSNGVVYVATAENRVYAIDAETGTKQWSFEAESFRSFSSPAVVKGRVFVSSGDGYVYAIDAASGSQKWATRPSQRAYSGVEATPSSVYLNRPAGVYALDAADGSVAWSVQFNGDDRDGRCTPTATDRSVFFGDSTGVVYALDARTGSQQWATTVGYPVYESPRVSDGTVYVSPGRLHALDAGSGTEQWVSLVGGRISSPPVNDGLVYAGGTDRVYGVDSETGETRVRYETGKTSAAPVVGGDTLYVTARAGTDEPVVYGLKTSVPNTASGSPTQPMNRQRSTQNDGSDRSETPAPTRGPVEENASNGGSGTRLPFAQVVTGGTVLVSAALLLGLYRRREGDTPDSDGKMPNAGQSSSATADAPSSETATLHLRNAADGPVTCRVRCRTENATRFQRDFRLGPGEGGALVDLPDEPVEVAVKVKDGPLKKQTFRPRTGPRDIGIVVASGAARISRIDSE